MKNIFLFSVLAASLFAASCESEFDPTVLGDGNVKGDVQEPSGECITLSIAAGPSDVELKSLFDQGGPAVKWGTGDILSVIDDEGNLHVSKPSETSAKTLEFVFENWPVANKPVYAFHTGAYGENLPTDTYTDGLINTSMESEQVVTKAGRFSRTPVIAIGDVVESEGKYSVSLGHAYGLVKLTIASDGVWSAVKLEGCGDNDALAGDVTLNPSTKELSVVSGVKSIQIVNEAGFASGSYYFCVLPGVITNPKVTFVAKEDGTEKSVQRSGDVTISAGVIADFGTLETLTESTVVDLSAEGTANCYVIDDAKGDYMFKAVKGNSDQSVGDVASAEVLWEDNYASTAITPGAIISKVSVKDDHICFTIPEGRIPGNALIAAKDSDGKILWSWHIWVCNKGEKPADIKLTDDLILMDRNIGSRQANNAETSMLYQWGRKDPFPGQYGAGHPTSHTGTIEVKASEGNTNDVARASISESIQNPTTLFGIYKDESATIWLETAGVIDAGVSATSTYLWGKSHTDKTIYDPCPAGYKVPHAWADPVDGIPSSSKRNLANSRFAALAGLEETATYASSVRTYTVADGSKLSFYATGWYLFGSTALPSLTYNTKTRDFHLWTASYQASQYAIVIDGNQSGISITQDVSVWTKNNAYAVRCEKIQN